MLVSIIIPCYNVQDYIEECVDSAISQIYKHIEVICIDNNSTDQTWEKLQNLKIKYPSLIVNKEPKPGAPAARNKGLKISKGEWLQFLDADDLIQPEKIKHQIGLINENYNAAFIASAYRKLNIENIETVIAIKESDPFKSLFITQLGITSSNLWNRQYIEQIGGWDESLKSSQEADLMFRLLQVNEEIIYDNEPLTIVRERAFGQISQTNHTAKWERYFMKRLEIGTWLKQNKQEHFNKEKPFYDDCLFGILKIMANENKNSLEKADLLFKQYLKDYHPSTNQTHSTPSYLILLRILGFKNSERIRQLIGR